MNSVIKSDDEVSAVLLQDFTPNNNNNDHIYDNIINNNKDGCSISQSLIRPHRSFPLNAGFSWPLQPVLQYQDPLRGLLHTHTMRKRFTQNPAVNTLNCQILTKQTILKFYSIL